jgi:hypothetical protein
MLSIVYTITVGGDVGFTVSIPMGSATEVKCGTTTSSWWPTFLTIVGATDGFTIGNPMGNAIEAILGTIVLFVDPIASAARGFAVAIPMGDATEA